MPVLHLDFRWFSDRHTQSSPTESFSAEVTNKHFPLLYIRYVRGVGEAAGRNEVSAHKHNGMGSLCFSTGCCLLYCTHIQYNTHTQTENNGFTHVAFIQFTTSDTSLLKRFSSPSESILKFPIKCSLHLPPKTEQDVENKWRSFTVSSHLFVSTDVFQHQ